jgi:hypothetical protein
MGRCKLFGLSVAGIACSEMAIDEGVNADNIKKCIA